MTLGLSFLDLRGSGGLFSIVRKTLSRLWSRFLSFLGFVMVKDDTSDNQEKMAEFHQALGAFVSAFAMVETNLYITIQIMANVSLPALRVLLPQGQARLTLDKTRELLKISTETNEDKKTLKNALDHLSQILKIRNSIMHLTLIDQPESDEYLLTNMLFARSEDQIRNFAVSPEILDQMKYDLKNIYYRLIWWQHLVLKSRGFSPNPREELQDNINEALKRAWLYKPRSPSKTNLMKADHDKSQTHQDPPESSQE